MYSYQLLIFSVSDIEKISVFIIHTNDSFKIIFLFFRDLSYRKYDICNNFSVIVTPVNARTNPRFDMRDKDGIIFDPIAPRAGERLIAKCSLVGLTDTDKRSVRIKLKF